MSRTVYLARNAQILAALSDDEYIDGKLRFDCDVVDVAPYYAERRLDEWETDAMHVFSKYVRIGLSDGDFEFNGSSSYEPDERQDSWVVAVYESPIADFAGDQLDALTEHPETVLHGYVEFVDQATRYSNALIELADLAEISPPSRLDSMRIALGDLLEESREHHDTTSDIVDALRDSDWEYVEGDLVNRGWSEAA